MGIVDGINEGIDQQHERELRGGHPQFVHVVDGRVGLEHVDRDGGPEHADGIVEGPGTGLGHGENLLG